MAKRKPKVIHVDKVIIKANEVTIQEEEKPKADEMMTKQEPEQNVEEDRFVDPWGFGRPVVKEENQVAEQTTEEPEESQAPIDGESGRSGWSWI